MSPVRALASAVALARAALGVAVLVVPEAIGSSWIGSAAEDPRVRVLIRAVGARDLALGAGTARALAVGRHPDAWLLASAASDSVDFAATLLARDELPARGVAITLPLAGSAAALCAAAALATARGECLVSRLIPNSRARGGGPGQAGRCTRSKRVAALRASAAGADPAPCRARHPWVRELESLV